METVKRVDVSALRRLTITILVNSVISACTFVCMLVSVFVLHSFEQNLTFVCVTCGITQTIRYITLVACVMLLGEINILSRKLLYSQRLLTAGLIVQCLSFLPVLINVYLIFCGYTVETSAFSILLAVFFTAERLLMGAGFMYLMKGFGECLEENLENASALPYERLGMIYFVIYILSIISTIIGSSYALHIASVFLFACAVLEFLMYRLISAAAFHTWRKKAFDVSA